MTRTVLACAIVLTFLPVALAAEKEETLLSYAKTAQGRFAYGMFVKGKKAGWAVDEIKVVHVGGKDVLRSVSTVFRETLFDKVRSRLESKTTVIYEVEGDGAIISATHEADRDGIKVKVEATRAGKKLKITRTQGSETTTRTVDLPRDTLIGQRDLERWLRASHKPGDKKKKFTVVDWDAPKIEEEETYTFKARKEAVVSGVKTALSSVVSQTAGLKIEADVFPDGRIYKADIGGFLELRLMPEQLAKKMDGKLVDIMEATSIFLDRGVGPSGDDVDELTLELSGVGDLKVPASRRQIVKASKGTITVTMKRDEPTDKEEALSKEEHKRYTASTARLNSDHKKVIALAKKVVDGEKDAGKAARKLLKWVNRNLKKSYSDNAENALDVLERKAGACVQHSLLFVALARAAGIPAREVGGVTYIKAKKPLMGWHAWVEYHDGKQWVAADPTFGQDRVDGSHLKLSEGSRDWAWANIVGTVKAKVVSVKKRDE
jgi:hypothetical protein